ncbi:beta-N-acetylhexosaminidase [Spirosoma utsteinense]|uniref:beta-N-acetylhexosaminidase n=1 Tax=Spirosoma utsteinense TaxID=2585773 RepID=A0ABR6VZG8_9BACT|nr:family 20 glycosylhydrolase [Spirosoma utsteinense]MBC3784565.1 hexosaminidase [Spirosoma utsteinense]MBC3789683.1 hexosaminidase [Spirosoma utsteinense]
MKLFNLLFSFFLIATSVLAQSPTPALLPYPQSVVLRSGFFRLTNTFSIGVVSPTPDTLLLGAANRMQQRLNQRTSLYFNQEQVLAGKSSGTESLVITVAKSTLPEIKTVESYTLTVGDKAILLNAPTTLGALHGLETLLQLVQADTSGFYLPQVQIIDAPRFVWRGFMMDVARHFISIDALKRTIDAMSAVKMNVLHLHLSDDEGFRVESLIFPRLHKAGSNGQYYTQPQIHELVAYAHDRGIIIVPEFDLPGHSRSWFAGYPELASAPGPYKPGPRFDIDRSKPVNMMAMMQLINTAATPTIDPTKEQTYQFLDKLLAEMVSLFPAPYLHIGADENNGVAWKQNPTIEAFMVQNNLKDTHALQNYFIRRIYALAKKYNRTMLAWEEAFGPELPPDVGVQIWKPALAGPVVSAQTITDKGNPVIISRGFYLDYFLPAHVHYSNDAIPSATLPALWGGEAALWSELVDETTVDGRAWPRAAAIAERFWSPASFTDVDDLYRRLFVISNQLEGNGLNHRLNSDRLLRQLANGQAIDRLKAVSDVLTPVKGYKRLMVQMGKPVGATYQRSPFNQLADLLNPDSEAAYEFRQLVKSYLQQKNGDTEIRLRQQLRIWQQAPSAIRPLLTQAPALKPLVTHAIRLSSAAQALLLVLDNPTEANKASALDTIKKARTASDEVEIAIADELEAVVSGTLKARPVSYSMF